VTSATGKVVQKLNVLQRGKDKDGEYPHSEHYVIGVAKSSRIQHLCVNRSLLLTRKYRSRIIVSGVV
jgi:hypothetical protein